MTTTEPFIEVPCIVELLGHRRLGAFVTEVELFGTKMMRLDIPKRDGTTWTQFVSPNSLYAITPVSEDIARAVAYRNEPTPVQPYELAVPRSTGDELDCPF